MSDSTAQDAYKDTVFLPRADFPMRAGLPKKEPEILARWAAEELKHKIDAASKGRMPFLLHDGPPYANGHIHIGHAQNKILKDVVNRMWFMMGRGINYVPGWDCHGLPIEWKIEEQYRAKGLDKDDVPILEFREECRQFAKHWVDVQSADFQRLGISGDWNNPYTTMTHAAEARIVSEIHRFVRSGTLYQGFKPVLWSVVEKTALAEAEVEYEEHKSITIWVRFPVVKASRPELEGAKVVIWTTTPWTIPGNRATAYGVGMEYAVYTVKEVAEGSRAVPGERLLLASALAEDVKDNAKILEWEKGTPFSGSALEGTLLAHPFRGKGYDFDVPMLPGDFVTDEQGTGIVHCAPGHGQDDFELGRAHDIEVPRTVGEDGRYYDSVPLFAGLETYTSDGKMGAANGAVIKELAESSALLSKGTLRHQYPHSWRSKAPLIFRATPQWFIAMDRDGLRDKALTAIDNTAWYPAQSRNRIRAMVENRPDWCISRQRAWGVPIAIFVRKSDGEILRDDTVLSRIVELFEAEGADAWWTHPAEDFLGDAYKADDFEQVFDIVDVWFESGSTHAFVLEDRDDLDSPADLYLEGSDQHRGWFHSSLLESVGTRGVAPYRGVLTHGFALDQDGRKMSKSLGNTVAPQEIIEKYGADILRLWVVNADYEDDVRIGPEIMKAQADLYRRLRNTLRYLIGNLDGFSAEEEIATADMPELERYILHRVWEMDRLVLECAQSYQYTRLFRALHDFCTLDLSAFYFDIRKDSIYCDRPDSLRRRAARQVLNILFESLITWLAPVLVFTCEEAWHARHGDDAESVHLKNFPEIPAQWQDQALAEKWHRVRQIRRVVTGALEIERTEKRIGASLQAHPVVYLRRLEDRAILEDLDLAELTITSSASVSGDSGPEDAFTLPEVSGVAVTVKMATGRKCVRCWQILETIGQNDRHPDLCPRCTEAVS